MSFTSTILLVDDEAEILAALEAGLRRGIPAAQVLTRTSAVEALDLLATHPVDVIISDQKMPRMEGVEFLIRSRALAPGAARIMLTAFPDQHLLERNVTEARIRHFFTKPYALADVVAVVRKLLDEQAQRAEAAIAFARAIDDARQPPKPVGPKHVGEPLRW